MKQLDTVHRRPTTPLDNSTYNHIPPTRSAPLPFYAPPSRRRCCRCRRHRHDNNIVVTTKARHVWLRKCSSARCSSSSTHNMQKKLLPRQVLNYIHVPPHVAVILLGTVFKDSSSSASGEGRVMLVNAMMLAQDHHHHSTPLVDRDESSLVASLCFLSMKAPCRWLLRQFIVWLLLPLLYHIPHSLMLVLLDVVVKYMEWEMRLKSSRNSSSSSRRRSTQSRGDTSGLWQICTKS